MKIGDILNSLGWLAIMMAGAALLTLVSNEILQIESNMPDVLWGVFIGWMMYDGAELFDAIWNHYIVGSKSK